jgi:hypothetical protein
MPLLLPITVATGDWWSLSFRPKLSPCQAWYLPCTLPHFFISLRCIRERTYENFTRPAEGLEPTQPCSHWILSPAHLPIPPRRRRERNIGILPVRQTANFTVSEFCYRGKQLFSVPVRSDCRGNCTSMPTQLMLAASASERSETEPKDLLALPPKPAATNVRRPFWGSSRPGPSKNSRSRIAGLRLFPIDDST